MKWLGKTALVLSCALAVAAVVLSSAAHSQDPPLAHPLAQRLGALNLPAVTPAFDFENPYRFASAPVDSTSNVSESIVSEAVESPPPIDESISAENGYFAPADALPRPWWSDALVSDEFRENPTPTVPYNASAAFLGNNWDLDALVWLTVKHSPFIKAVLIEPQILQTRATQASGEFDPNTFVNSIFRDNSDPVGNTLTTGNASRLNEHIYDNRFGIQAKNTRGGLTELSQQFLYTDSNSNFFVPSDQASTKMLLRYTQPLMRGRGEAYNKSSIVIASLKANQNAYEVSLSIQKHVFQVTSSYWELYVARANYAQIENGIKSLVKLKEQLQGRADLDGLQSQLMRAEAAISRQEANLARALAQILISEAALRATVAAPEIRDQSIGGVIPSTPTADWRATVIKHEELSLALDYHPEIQAIRSNLKAQRVKLHVAENELRPTLDLVLEGYLRGLNGDFNSAKSFGDQFSTGQPSLAAGVSYARPYNNVTARAALRERRLELQRELHQLDNKLLTVGADVEGAVANVNAAYQQLDSSVRSTIATHAELEYLTARWGNAFVNNASTSLLLDQLLNAEVQLIQAENAWARAQADHMLTIARLRLATGTILPLIAPTGQCVLE